MYFFSPFLKENGRKKKKKKEYSGLRVSYGQKRPSCTSEAWDPDDYSSPEISELDQKTWRACDDRRAWILPEGSSRRLLSPKNMDAVMLDPPIFQEKVRM